MSRFERSANVKFCRKLGKTAAETLECLIIVCAGEALKKTIGLNVSRVKNQGSVEDEGRQLQKNYETIEKVQNVVPLRIQRIENTITVSYGSIQSVFSAPCSKCILRISTEVQMEKRKSPNFSNDQQTKTIFCQTSFSFTIRMARDNVTD